MPGEELSYSINIPLLAVAVTIIGITITAVFQLNSLKRDRRKEQEKKEETQQKHQDEIINALNKNMDDNLKRGEEKIIEMNKNTIAHFDDRIELLKSNIKDNDEEIKNVKTGLEKLTYEVLEIIKQGSAGAKARMDAIEQRLKAIEERLK